MKSIRYCSAHSYTWEKEITSLPCPEAVVMETMTGSSPAAKVTLPLPSPATALTTEQKYEVPSCRGTGWGLLPSKHV